MEKGKKMGGGQRSEGDRRERERGAESKGECDKEKKKRKRKKGGREESHKTFVVLPWEARESHLSL